MKRAKRTIVILSLALASCRGPVMSPTVTPYTVSVRIMATTCTAPVLAELAGAYRVPDTILAFEITTASWPTVRARLIAGEVPFALTTSPAADPALWAAPIGYEGIAIVVHPTNPITALSVTELHALFQGGISSWQELGGADEPVTVVSFEAGDDLRTNFEALVMQGGAITLGARLALSGAAMLEIVQREPGAIGYVSLAQLSERVPAPVRVVPLRPAPDEPPVLPTPATITSAAYPLHVPVLLVGLEPPTPEGAYYAWFTWMQSPAGQNIIRTRMGTFAFPGASEDN